MPTMTMTMTTALAAQVRARPDAVALLGDDGAPTTYAELGERVRALRDELAGAGVRTTELRDRAARSL